MVLKQLSTPLFDIQDKTVGIASTSAATDTTADGVGIEITQVLQHQAIISQLWQQGQLTSPLVMVLIFLVL